MWGSVKAIRRAGIPAPRRAECLERAARIHGEAVARAHVVAVMSRFGPMRVARAAVRFGVVDQLLVGDLVNRRGGFLVDPLVFAVRHGYRLEGGVIALASEKHFSVGDVARLCLAAGEKLPPAEALLICWNADAVASLASSMSARPSLPALRIWAFSRASALEYVKVCGMFGYMASVTYETLWQIEGAGGLWPWWISVAEACVLGGIEVPAESLEHDDHVTGEAAVYFVLRGLAKGVPGRYRAHALRAVRAARTVQRAWRLRRRHRAAVVVQRRWRHAAANPNAALGRRVQTRRFARWTGPGRPDPDPDPPAKRHRTQ